MWMCVLAVIIYTKCSTGNRFHFTPVILCVRVFHLEEYTDILTTVFFWIRSSWIIWRSPFQHRSNSTKGRVTDLVDSWFQSRLYLNPEYRCGNGASCIQDLTKNRVLHNESGSPAKSKDRVVHAIQVNVALSQPENYPGNFNQIKRFKLLSVRFLLNSRTLSVIPN